MKKHTMEPENAIPKQDKDIVEKFKNTKWKFNENVKGS